MALARRRPLAKMPAMARNYGHNRIREARKHADITLEALAERTGISVAYLSRMESGGRNVSLRNLEKIAAALSVSPAQLVHTDEEDAEPAGGIRYGGIVEAGAFRPWDGLNQVAEHRRVPLPPDPRYPAAAQFAFEVIGDSMNKANIAPGMWVQAVDRYEWERSHGGLRDSLLVIVARTRNAEPERELTVKRLRIFSDRHELQPESTNPVHKPISYPYPPPDDGTAEAEVIAVVLSSHWVYT